jgi:hypothetical protein
METKKSLSMQEKHPSRQKSVATKPSQNERQWREVEKSIDYLVKTSKPGVGWHELLGRNNEICA